MSVAHLVAYAHPFAHVLNARCVFFDDARCEVVAHRRVDDLPSRNGECRDEGSRFGDGCVAVHDDAHQSDHGVVGDGIGKVFEPLAHDVELWSHGFWPP